MQAICDVSHSRDNELIEQPKTTPATNDDEAPWPNPIYAWYVVGVLMLAYTNSFIDRQILSLLVEPIRADLGISDTQISLLAGLAFSVFYTVMGIPLARLPINQTGETLLRWALQAGA